ncbi:MAG: glutamine-hydrolyzing carbamoyl-phosphate synthase small subunit [Deltaproteobacteria bacterium]|jgi:carbamoyl-phosphate synthase small subunit|nr:glutamine-hydrolyzing carbamoyl-phosphate synthase small subunit [Deltaproteobacteria bacterium]
MQSSSSAPRASRAHNPPGLLALADGTVLHGVGVGATGVSVGEVVFNTAMTGYQEILSDPSYHQQIVTLTASHVGNTGITVEDDEAPGPQVSGLIVRDVPRLASSWRKTESLSRYLQRHDIVALAEVDTRRLTHLLREKGAQNGCLVVGGVLDVATAVDRARAFSGLNGADLAKVVTLPETTPWLDGSIRWLGDHTPFHAPAEGPHVVAYDFGIKRNILRMLVDRGCKVTIVPAETPAERALALQPDGLFLSNGPGDPAPVTYAQEAIRRFVAKGLPVFGICLGHQLLCLALGAKTLKMKFGHHGANHPVKELATGRVLISSQNHGFAADPTTLPPELRVTHVSLFDGSLQGVEHTSLPVFSFQGHPEASPGPHELAHLFDRFVADLARRRAA